MHQPPHSPRDASRRYHDRVARQYDAIGSASDAVLATTWAARVSGVGIDRTGRHLARVRAFAERNRAPGLLALATGAPRRASSGLTAPPV